MNTTAFIVSLLDEVRRLTPVHHLQINTLGDFVRFSLDPNTKLSRDVSRDHIEQLKKKVEGFVRENLIACLKSGGLDSEEAAKQEVADQLVDFWQALLVARSKYYLSLIKPIYGLAANPNVVYDVYKAGCDGQDLAVAHAKGAEKWAQRQLDILELNLKKDNKELSPEQRKCVLEGFRADATRVHPLSYRSLVS